MSVDSQGGDVGAPPPLVDTRLETSALEASTYPLPEAGGSGVGVRGVAPASTIGTTGPFTNQDVNGLLSGAAWNATNLTFSFPTSGELYGVYGSTYGDGAINSFQPLSEAQKTVARYALGLISQYTNLAFTEISETSSNHATIRFGGSASPTTSYSYLPNNESTGGDVFLGNIRNTTPIKGGYAFAIILHETGHAVGLKHGNENNFYGALPPEHDSSEWSIMDYHSYVGGDDFYRNFDGSGNQTYMVNDISALQYMYGANFNTNAGNTTYTWNPMTGELSINGVGQTASSTSTTYQALWDGGGVDTYDLSNFSAGDWLNIDLRPGYWSTFSHALLADLDVGAPGLHRPPGSVANANLYANDPRSLIENVVGGAGFDSIRGNQANNMLWGALGGDKLWGEAGADVLIGGGGADILTGGAGADTFRDTAAGLNGDTITDLSVDDRVVIADASLSGFSYQLSGSTLTYTGGSLTLQNLPSGARLVASAATGGGVMLQLAAASVPGAFNADFNGDGRSDVFWRNDNGALASWIGQAGGGFASNAAVGGSVSSDWKIGAVGDFNGDGRSDLFWRNDSSALSGWLGQANGGFVSNAAVGGSLSADWKVAGVGDFNGDGRSDLFWRNDSGAISSWAGQANGGFAGTAVGGSISLDWKVAAVGDFNGDGRSDVFWRNDSGANASWLGQVDGGFVSDAAVSGTVSSDWKIAGVGDFNGDGRDDLFWRNDSGAIASWLGQAGGGFLNNAAVSGVVSTDWKIVNLGDYNGDGYADIFWRNDSGAQAGWLGQAGGGFIENTAVSGNVSPDWWMI